MSHDDRLRRSSAPSRCRGQDRRHRGRTPIREDDADAGSRQRRPRRRSRSARRLVVYMRMPFLAAAATAAEAVDQGRSRQGRHGPRARSRSARWSSAARPTRPRRSSSSAPRARSRSVGKPTVRGVEDHALPGRHRPRALRGRRKERRRQRPRARSEGDRADREERRCRSTSGSTTTRSSRRMPGSRPFTGGRTGWVDRQVDDGSVRLRRRVKVVIPAGRPDVVDRSCRNSARRSAPAADGRADAGRPEDLALRRDDRRRARCASTRSTRPRRRPCSTASTSSRTVRTARSPTGRAAG